MIEVKVWRSEVDYCSYWVEVTDRELDQLTNPNTSREKANQIIDAAMERSNWEMEIDDSIPSGDSSDWFEMQSTDYKEYSWGPPTDILSIQEGLETIQELQKYLEFGNRAPNLYDKLEGLQALLLQLKGSRL